MAGTTKLMTAGGGGVSLTPASSIASDVTVNVPSVNCTLYGNAGTTITSGTAVASTSGTTVDFTGIPSWVKRITVMFNGVSGNGSSNLIVQLGTGSFSYTTSGYNSTTTVAGGTVATTSATNGFVIWQDTASFTMSGSMVLTKISGNVWVASSVVKLSTSVTAFSGGDVTISAELTAVRITRVNGTDTFDAGSINILYE